MVKKLCAVKDRLVGFLAITLEPNVDVAVRRFKTAAEDPTTDFFANPADYELYLLGDIDMSTGLVKPLEVPELLVVASECVPVKEV